MTKIRHDIKILVLVLSIVALTLVMANPHFAQGADQGSKSGQDLGKIGAKLVNPISNLWALLPIGDGRYEIITPYKMKDGLMLYNYSK
jgi:hypothetical protein